MRDMSTRQLSTHREAERGLGCRVDSIIGGPIILMTNRSRATDNPVR